jgi:hypothetical protein
MNTQDCNIDSLLARAQVGLCFLTTFGFFGLLTVLIFWHKDMNTQAVTILTGLVSVLGTIWTMQMQFFFSRTRHQALPDPPPGTVITTATPPSVVAVTTPAGPSGAPISVPLVPPQPETKT